MQLLYKRRRNNKQNKIFISYRRADSSGHTGRLYDSLVALFGEDKIFLDIDSIKGGSDFVEVIDETLEVCIAIIVVIGPSWTTITDENGNKRLEAEKDYVRLEVEEALSKDLIVCPVLVDGAEMPHQHEVPESIRGLSRFNAFHLNDNRWSSDGEHVRFAR